MMSFTEKVLKLLESKILFTGFFAVLSFIFLWLIISSLNWTYGLDNNPLFYFAFLTDKFGYLPYRDFFYFQMPGVHLYYLLIGKIFGYTYTGFRLADICYLTLTFVVTFFVFKKINWKVAWGSSIYFCLLYILGHSYFSMQREYVLILPIFLSVLVTVYFPKLCYKLKFIIAGFCCAIAALIKPQAALAYPVVLAFQFWNNDKEYFMPFSMKTTAAGILLSITGFITPILFVLLFLSKTDSFLAFWDIQSNFQPLYRELPVSPGNYIVKSTQSFWYFINEHMRFGNQRLLFIPALLGIFISFFRSSLSHEQKRLIYLFIALAIVFNVHVAIGAKYFSYHWLPFYYCIIFLSFLCFVEPAKLTRYKYLGRLLPLVIIYAVVAIRIIQQSDSIFLEFNDGYKENRMLTNIDDAAGYLKQNLRPGDKVLSLDGLGLAQASMLLAGAEQATYYSSPWFLNIPELSNNEYIIRHRRNFIAQLKAEKPRFIIDLSGGRWFDDLEAILDADYQKVPGKNYTLYSRR